MRTRGHEQPFVSAFTYSHPRHQDLKTRQSFRPKRMLWDYRISTGCQMKAELLCNRLKQKRKQRTVIGQRLKMNLNDSIENKLNIQRSSTSQFLRTIKKQIARVEATSEQVYRNLSVQKEMLYKRSQKIVEDKVRSQNEIKTELQGIANAVQQMGAIQAKQRPSTQFSVYSNVLNQLNLANRSNLVSKSLKPINSSLFEGSLLLSCKKNNEQEQQYATLKYSEDSHQIRQQQFSSGRLSGEEEKMYAKKKHQIQPKLQIKDIQNKLLQLNTDDSVSDDQPLIDKRIQKVLYSTKEELENRHNYISKTLQNQEAVLERLIQDIAEEKVQREAQWNDLISSTKQSFDEMVLSLSQLCTASKTHDQGLEQSLSNLQKSLSIRVEVESRVRKGESQSLQMMLLSMVQDLE